MTTAIRSADRAILLTWVVRALGTVVLVLLIGQGWAQLQKLVGDHPLAVHLHSIGFLVVLVGLALGWISRQLGGGLIIGGFIWAILGLGVGAASGEIGFSAIFRAGLVMLPAVLIAALYLFPTALQARTPDRAGT